MIPFGVELLFYSLSSALMFFAAIAYFALGIYFKNKKSNVYHRVCLLLVLWFLVVGCLILAIPLSGTTGVVNMTICNKDGGTVISTSQQEYFLNGNRLVDMKSVVGKQITAHVYQEWPDQYPTIYDIDGPVPCGDATCGV